MPAFGSCTFAEHGDLSALGTPLPMPAHFINDPKHWRDRAEEMRRLATAMADERTRETMLRIAADYDNLARRAEERSGGSPHAT